MCVVVVVGVDTIEPPNATKKRLINFNWLCSNVSCIYNSINENTSGSDGNEESTEEAKVWDWDWEKDGTNIVETDVAGEEYVLDW